METRTPSKQHNHPASEPTQIRCSRCGAYSPHWQISYWNPQTGEQKNLNNPAAIGCLVGGVSIAILFFLVYFLVDYLNHIQYGPTLPGYVSDGEAFMIILIAFVVAPIVAPIAFLISYRWRRNRLRKYYTITYFTCRQCTYQWTVTQAPAKKLS